MNHNYQRYPLGSKTYCVGRSRVIQQSTSGFAWMTYCLVVFMAIQLTACGGAVSDTGLGNGTGGDPESSSPDIAAGDGDGDGFVDSDSSTEAEGSSQSGQQGDHLTAGAWDDNLNFDFFESFLNETEADIGFEISTGLSKRP